MWGFTIAFILLVSSCFPGGSGSSSLSLNLSDKKIGIISGGQSFKTFTVLEDEEYTLDLSALNIAVEDIVFEAESGTFRNATYRPNEDFNGEDYISVTAEGKKYVYIATVTPVNDSPSTKVFDANVVQNVTKTLDASNSIVDPDNLISDLKIELIEEAEGIDIKVLSDGKIEVLAGPELFGPSNLKLSVTDPEGLSSSLDLKLTVTDLAGNDFDSRIPVQCFYFYDGGNNERLPYVGGSYQEDCKSAISRLNTSMELDGEKIIELKYVFSDEIDNAEDYKELNTSKVNFYANTKGNDNVVTMFFSRAMRSESSTGLVGRAISIGCAPGPTCSVNSSHFNTHSYSVPGNDIVLRHEMGHIFSARHTTATDGKQSGSTFNECQFENNLDGIHRIITSNRCGEETTVVQRCDGLNQVTPQGAFVYDNKTFRYGNNVMRWRVYSQEEGFWNSGDGYTEAYVKKFKCWKKNTIDHLRSVGM